MMTLCNDSHDNNSPNGRTSLLLCPSCPVLAALCKCSVEVALRRLLCVSALCKLLCARAAGDFGEYFAYVYLKSPIHYAAGAAGLYSAYYTLVLRRDDMAKLAHRPIVCLGEPGTGKSTAGAASAYCVCT